MGLLDGGISAIFGAAFGGIYLAGTLHRAGTGEDADGRVTTTFDDVPMRYQPDAISDIARATAGIPTTDVRVLILADGLGGKPKAEDEMTIAAGRFRISTSEADPATSHFKTRGSPV